MGEGKTVPPHTSPKNADRPRLRWRPLYAAGCRRGRYAQNASPDVVRRNTGAAAAPYNLIPFIPAPACAGAGCSGNPESQSPPVSTTLRPRLRGDERVIVPRPNSP
jgi:hypothetical protein